jgi:hypothetical protein
LLRLTFAAALAPPEGDPGSPDFDGESPFRPAGRFVNSHIIWRFVPAGLDEVLETGLRIDAGAFAFKLAKFGCEQPEDERPGDTVTVRRVDGADKRFEDPGEVAVTGAATGGFLTAPKDHVFAEVEADGHAGEGAPPDNVGTHARQVTFAGSRVTPEEFVGDDHAQERITEEFEAFI